MSMTDSRGFHEAADADHREIAKAVFEGDVAGASQAMLEHTDRMIEFYRSQTPAIFSLLIEWR